MRSSRTRSRARCTAALLALAAAGCVRAGFDSSALQTPAPDREAGRGESRPADSRGDSRRDGVRADVSCTLGPFSPPVNLAAVNTAHTEYAPAISGDGLTLLFGSPDRPGAAGDGDLWMATRAGANDPFGAPAPLQGLNTAGWEGDPDLSLDARVVFFDRETLGGSRDIYTAARASSQGGFGGAVLVAGVNSSATDQGAAISADGLELYFDSSRAGGAGSVDIWVARRPSTSGAFSAPELVTGVNTPAVDAFPSITGDGLTLYFETDRAGGTQIWSAQRASRSAPFYSAAPVGVSSSSSTDGDPDISADGRTLYFASDRAGGKGGLDIWVAVRGCATK